MNLKLKIKYDKKSKKTILSAWIQKHKDFEPDIYQLLHFFKDQIQFSIKRRLFPYYKIISENPAIILSLFTSIQESIPEVYFSNENSIEIDDLNDN